MIKFLIKSIACLGFWAVLVALPICVEAADTDPASSVPLASLPADDGRDASFLPPPSFDQGSVPPDTKVSKPPAVVAAPIIIAPAAPLAVLPAPMPAPIPPSAIPTLVSPPAASVQTSSAPVKSLEAAKLVESATLGDINPESIGLFSANQGGLGAAMWKGTSRSLVDSLLSSVNLPTLSPALNNLAQRFLLTTADVPDGSTASTSSSLTSTRLNLLLQLGDVADAWKFAHLAKPEQIDDATLQNIVEAALLTSQRTDVCAELPDMSKNRTKVDWQESLVVCQLIGKDTKAAQLTLDLMHTQNVKDETFFYLAERNVMASAKELPRQLTPLKPLTLALLQLSDLPVRAEVYAHPEAKLMSALLATKTKDDNARLALAERAGDRGIISAADLEAIYASIVFPAEAIANASNSTETGAHLRALMYQAAVQEKAPEKRVIFAVKFVQGSTAAELNGVQGHVLGDMIGTIAPADIYNATSGIIAKIYILSGNPQASLEWLKQARHAAIGIPDVAAELQNLWPLMVFTGLETDAEYSKDLGKWIDGALKTADPKDDNHILRSHAGSILLLLDAAGFAVPEEDWAKVVSVPNFERHPVPPPLLLERLRSAGTASHMGEAVMLSLLLLGGNVDDPSFTSTLAVIRSLRLVGLNADAVALAKEAAALILASSNKS